MFHPSPLRLYGQASSKPGLEWDWVEGRLRAAPTYWVVARNSGCPHPRPVWGVWADDRLHLSIGTPLTLRALELDPLVTVHLDTGTEAVIVEGRAAGAAADPDIINAYNQKYDWDYDTARYGPLQCVAPGTVLAWRTAGWAGRDSFQQTGRWSRQPGAPPVAPS